MIGAEVTFVNQQLAAPLRLSTGSIKQLTEARAQVTVRLSGYEAIGRSSIYLSDLWSWPDVRLTHEYRDASLRQLCQDALSRLFVTRKSIQIAHRFCSPKTNPVHKFTWTPACRISMMLSQ